MFVVSVLRLMEELRTIRKAPDSVVASLQEPPDSRILNRCFAHVFRIEAE